MGPSTVLNTSKCGSGAHRPTNIWQNLIPNEELEEAYFQLSGLQRPINDILDHAGLNCWRLPLPPNTVTSTLALPMALPRFSTRPPLIQAAHTQSSTTGLLWKDGTLTPPSPEVRETLMGFTKGDTNAPGLSPAQRIHILGMCTGLNILHWTMVQSTKPGHQHIHLGDTTHTPPRPPTLSPNLSPIWKKHRHCLPRAPQPIYT